jgi:hypothetical protein
VDEIDRELSSELSIEPSPEFRARVRARISERPRSWFPQWYVPVAGAAALSAAIAMAVGLGVRENAPQARPPVLEQRSRQEVAVLDPPASGPVHRSVSTANRGRPRVRAPEVLIAPSEARGFRQLQALVEEGRTAFVFLSEDASDPAPEPVRDIVIAPIVIAPLETAAIAESVGN